jgi:hypothetical protein
MLSGRKNSMKKILTLAAWWGLCPYQWGPLPPFQGDALHQDCPTVAATEVEVNISTGGAYGKHYLEPLIQDARSLDRIPHNASLR